METFKHEQFNIKESEITEAFESARDFLENLLIEMPLSDYELKGLRRIAKEVLLHQAQDLLKQTSGDSTVSQEEEIPYRFIYEFYGKRMDELLKNNTYAKYRKTRDMIEANDPEIKMEDLNLDNSIKKWFRSEQKKRYLT